MAFYKYLPSMEWWEELLRHEQSMLTPLVDQINALRVRVAALEKLAGVQTKPEDVIVAE